MHNWQQSDAIDLLWTGGWDSTFRLLQILLEERKKVQPYYVVDPQRNSAGTEIQIMWKLKRSIQIKYPFTKELFLPTNYVNVESIEPDAETVEAYHYLKTYVALGSQYIFLPSFCKQNGIYGLEMSIEDGAYEDFTWSNLSYLKNNFSDDPDELPEEERKIYTTSKTIFKYFKFPIINLSKQEAFTVVQKSNWMPIMRETWFCYQPLNVPFRGNVPCGNCITCKFQKKSGFSWRIPKYVQWFQTARKFKRKLTSPADLK